MSDESIRALERELERQGRSLASWASEVLGFGTVDPQRLGVRLLGFDDDPARAMQALRVHPFVRAFVDHISAEGHRRLEGRFDAVEGEVRRHVPDPARRNLLRRLDDLRREMRRTTVAPDPPTDETARTDLIAAALEADHRRVTALLARGAFRESLTIRVDPQAFAPSCLRCRGSGRIVTDRGEFTGCPDCRGTGSPLVARNLNAWGLDGCGSCGEPSGMLNGAGLCPSCAHADRP